MTFVDTTRKVLKVLEYEHGPVTTEMIGARAGDCSTEAARAALLELERGGFVKRVPAGDDFGWSLAK